MTPCAAPSSGSGRMVMPRVASEKIGRRGRSSSIHKMAFSATANIAIVAAFEREVAGLIKASKRVERSHQGRQFVFFERGDTVTVCGGIGLEAARRAAEAAIALYHPTLLHSVGFAGALQSGLRIGDLLVPAVVIDARDGSRVEVAGGSGVLLTFMTVAGVQQKSNLAQAYAAQAVDMEAAAVAEAAHAHNVAFRATKVISDGLDFEMPEMASFIDANGRFQTASFALYAAPRPWLWRRLIALAANSGKAAGVLDQYLKRSILPQVAVLEAKTSGISSKP